MKTILGKQNWEISILANLPYKNSGWKNYNSNPDLQALDPMPFQYITKERTFQEEGPARAKLAGCLVFLKGDCVAWNDEGDQDISGNKLSRCCVGSSLSLMMQLARNA